MPVYRVIDKTTRKTVYAYSADAACDFAEFPFATFDHIEEVNIASDGSIAADVGTRITKLAFRNRFTQAEKVAIEIAALDDTTKPMVVRAQSAALRSSQADILSATFIDLTRTDTRAGVQMLESAGLLASGRALVILDTPPTADELYQGQ